jgi:anti-sigma B factor antagonist
MSRSNHSERASFVDSDLLWIDRMVDNHAVSVRAVGEVDLISAPLLSAQLQLAEAVVVPPAPVRLDLTGVTFIGSAGLSVLLEHHERCAALGSRLQVVGGRVVTRVLAVAGLTEEISVVPGPTVAASTVDSTYSCPPQALN